MSASRWPRPTIRSSAARANPPGGRAARDEAPRVVVVGAGPAGLQAARIAAQRGHDVTLLGASQQLGGKLRWEAGLPGKADIATVLAWMERQFATPG